MEPANGHLAFGAFRLDLNRRQLTRDGVPVRLTGRAFDVLCVLATAEGEIVSKDTLMQRVWPDVVVQDNNLQVHISALRRALDDNDSGELLITVAGRGYRLNGVTVAGQSRSVATDARQGPVVPDRPSIAVLPFNNMSADPEQDYFADGIVEEITTALSRVRWLFVIARNSSFTYKGRSVDIKRVGAELGVRYVLEGSVRKAAGRVRIAGQLIDASSGAHLWADHIDGPLDDIFDLQDRVTASVVGTIEPKLQQAEIERAKRKPTESLDAYDWFLRGFACLHRMSEGMISEALRLFGRSIALDPDYASPHGAAAFCYAMRRLNNWPLDLADIVEARRLATLAAELGKDDPAALASAGLAFGWVAGDFERAIKLIDRARDLNPNFANAWYASGAMRAVRGEPDVAIDHLSRAMRLSPFDPLMFGMLGFLGVAHFCAGRYQEAAEWADKAVLERPGIQGNLRTAVVSNAMAGRQREAERALGLLLELNPGLRIQDIRQQLFFWRRENFARYEEALRKAGLPE